MIKSWDKFNEDITSITKSDDESRYQKYKSTYIELVRANIPQVEKIIDDVKECFISFEDDGLVKKYQFGGMYNPDKRKNSEEYFSTRPSPSMHRKAFYPEADEEMVKSIADFLLPRYWGEYVNRFISIGIDFPFQKDAWIGGEGIDLMDNLIEAKNRLKSMGYSMEIKFWKMWNPEPTRHGYSPLEVRVYFDLDCEWPEIYQDEESFNTAGRDPQLREI